MYSMTDTGDDLSHSHSFGCGFKLMVEVLLMQLKLDIYESNHVNWRLIEIGWVHAKQNISVRKIRLSHKI